MQSTEKAPKVPLRSFKRTKIIIHPVCPGLNCAHVYPEKTIILDVIMTCAVPAYPYLLYLIVLYTLMRKHENLRPFIPKGNCPYPLLPNDIRQGASIMNRGIFELF